MILIACKHSHILTVLTFRALAEARAVGAVLVISLTDSNPSLLIDIFSLLLSSLPFSWPTKSSYEWQEKSDGLFARCSGGGSSSRCSAASSLAAWFAACCSILACLAAAASSASCVDDQYDCMKNIKLKLVPYNSKVWQGDLKQFQFSTRKLFTTKFIFTFTS